MAFPTHTLTSTWWTAADWIDPDSPFFAITGTGVVEFAWSAAAPVNATVGIPIEAGVYQMGAPMVSMQLYLRCTSGTASVQYAQDVGARLDTAACGSAFYGAGGSDTGFNAPLLQLQVGHNGNTYEEVAYLPTIPAGLSASSTVDNAYLVVPWICRRSDRTIRLYGLKYATSQYSSITGWSSLAGKTKTTAYTDVVTSGEGYLRADVKSIVQELQGVTGWSPTSPIQLYVKDAGSDISGTDTRTQLMTNLRHARLTIVLSGGVSPVPDPDPGTIIGGP